MTLQRYPLIHTQSWEREKFTLGAQDVDLEFWAHASPHYQPRTMVNASCDVTIAIAADYSTAGERLTAQLAKDRYLALPLYLTSNQAGQRLAQFMQQKQARSLNIAGNGIYTLHQKNWSEEAVQQFVLELLYKAHSEYPIERIQTGGQTGLDWIGAVCARALDIPCTVLFPASFKQRLIDSKDRNQDPILLMDAFKNQCNALKQHPFLQQKRPSPSPDIKLSF